MSLPVSALVSGYSWFVMVMSLGKVFPWSLVLHNSYHCALGLAITTLDSSTVTSWLSSEAYTPHYQVQCHHCSLLTGNGFTGRGICCS